MNSDQFKPHHINATSEDLAGNNGIGRYILLPGSDGRAQDISQNFKDLLIKPHPRGHHLYLGTINNGEKSIDVAAISSGMGCPSMEIILHELFHLGGKRFLRVGTAGSLQSKLIPLGDMINVHAAVRDENTTIDYVPLTVPAVASIECIEAILRAAKKMGISSQIHTGTVHCKSSLYAREFGAGPEAERNNTYLKLLTNCGILATEMETSALFIQSQLYNYQLMLEGKGAQHRVLWGAILGIIALLPNKFVSAEEENVTVNKLIDLAIETVKILADIDQNL